MTHKAMHTVTLEHTLIYKREIFVMKTILEIILIILGLGIGAMFLPAIAGIAIGIIMIRNGSIFGGILVIAIGLACQAVMLFFIYDVDVPVHVVHIATAVMKISDQETFVALHATSGRSKSDIMSL